MREAVTKLLDSLSEEELQEARTYIDFRTARVSGGDVSRKDVEHWRAICVALEGYGPVPNETALKLFLGNTDRKGFGLKPYRKAIGLVDVYVAQALGSHTVSKAEYILFCSLCYEALRTRARHAGVPLTPTTILQHTVSLETAMEFLYPGYFRAGLLHILVTGRKRRDAN